MRRPESRPVLEKVNFDDIYDRPDPRAYYRALGELDYEVPHHGQRVFRSILAALGPGRATVVDVCCSYGVNAALLTCSLTLDELYAHYDAPALDALSRAELLAADRELYAERRLPDAPRVVGVDVAAPAVAYALEAGLLADGVTQDLEQTKPTPATVRSVESADLVTVTGGIGYITERTVGALLDSIPDGRQPWVAALCLRTVSYAPIADALDRRGLVTERLAGRTFPQRRFADDDERAYALTELDALGIDPSGKESEGAFHTDVYLSRPAEAASAMPIDDLLTDI